MVDAIYLVAIVVIAVVFLIYGVKIALIMEDIIETIAYLVTWSHRMEPLEEGEGEGEEEEESA